MTCGWKSLVYLCLSLDEHTEATKTPNARRALVRDFTLLERIFSQVAKHRKHNFIRFAIHRSMFYSFNNFSFVANFNSFKLLNIK